jgi:2-dehydropantoate 2-reductase
MSTDAIHVVGAGGIGCALGHALRSAGHSVFFVETDDDKIGWGRRHGVVVSGRPACSAEFISFAQWQAPADGFVVLCTKCYDNAVVLERLPPGATLVPVQNGFDPELEARQHAVEGIASFVSECVPGQTHVRITRPGDLHLGAAGEPTPATRALVARLAGLLHGGPYRIRIVADVRPFKHTKLAYNSAISPLAAAAGLDNGALLGFPRVRRLFLDLLRENYRILRRAGKPLGKVGPLHPRWVDRVLARPWLANLLAHAFEPSLRGTYCSMAGDIERGRTEIDNYNGYLIRLAGGDCPLNQRVYELVTRMTRDGTGPDLGMLGELMDEAVNGS